MSIQRRAFPRGDPEWKQERAKYITATDMAALFGLNSYSSPSKVLATKVAPTFADNEFTRMGRILEPAVVQALNEDLNLKVELFAKGYDVVYAHQKTRISATPDAYIDHPSGSGISTVVELKTTSTKKLRTWELSPPLHYFVQLATQCYVLDCTSGMLAGLAPEYPDMPLLVFDFVATEDMYDLMVHEVARFWDSTSAEKTTYRVNTKNKKLMTEMLTTNIKLRHAHASLVAVEFPEIDWGV